MIVLCNDKMTELVPPTRATASFVDKYRCHYVVAEYADTAALLSVTDEQVTDADAWWREVGLANIEIQFDREAIRAQGVFDYLGGKYGISSERNVAAAIGEMAADAGLDPLDLWSWVIENG